MVVSMLVAVLLQTPAPPTRVSPNDGQERPLYRKVQPGEQRDEGLLRRITCPGRGPVKFVVNPKVTKDAKDAKEPGAVMLYTAPQLASVDFIVYRKDFRGPVTCEGFGAGVPVYVTWKPDGKMRRVVAIEFLSK
jgi:hypothetical protein